MHLGLRFVQCSPLRLAGLRSAAQKLRGIGHRFDAILSVGIAFCCGPTATPQRNPRPAATPPPVNAAGQIRPWSPIRGRRRLVTVDACQSGRGSQTCSSNLHNWLVSSSFQRNRPRSGGGQANRCGLSDERVEVLCIRSEKLPGGSARACPAAAFSRSRTEHGYAGTLARGGTEDGGLRRAASPEKALNPG
jgi:hypothetical protein